MIIIVRGIYMNTIRNLFLDHPTLSKVIIFPISLAISFGLISFLINIVLPVSIAAGLTYWVHSLVVGERLKDKMWYPFSYIHSKYYSN